MTRLIVMIQIEGFDKIAPFLNHPLVLIGFVVLLFFGLLRTLLGANIIPPLPRTTGGEIIKVFLKYGFIIAILIILLGFALKGYELYQSGKKLSNADEVRHELNRSHHLIKDIRVSAAANIPLTHLGIASYKVRLIKGAEPFRHTAGDTSKNRDGIAIFTNTDGDTGKVTTIGILISLTSSLFPNKDSEKLAWRALAKFGVNVVIYKTPIGPNVYIQQRPQEDLHFEANIDKGFDIFELYYEFGSNFIEVRADGMRVSQEEYWRTNGSIISIPDLSGAQMFVILRDYETGDEKVDDAYQELEKDAEIGHIRLRINDRQYFVGRPKLKRIPQAKYPIYYYTLPPDMVRADVNLP